MGKKRVYFLLFFEFHRESSRDFRGMSQGTSTVPQRCPGLGFGGERRLRPKPGNSLVRMRPRELCLGFTTRMRIRVRLHI